MRGEEKRGSQKTASDFTRNPALRQDVTRLPDFYCAVPLQKKDAPNRRKKKRPEDAHSNEFVGKRPERMTSPSLETKEVNYGAKRI